MRSHFQLTLEFLLSVEEKWWPIQTLYDIEKEEKKMADLEIKNKAIQQTLDEYRDKLIFDEDPQYWKILEKLSDNNSS